MEERSESGAGPSPPSVWDDAHTARSVWPSISVVVPIYNRAAFLPACLGALFAQTYPRDRYEIVLVDDGSTDGTPGVARALASTWDGSLRVITRPNGGPASARNAGIDAAAGEIIAFTDSDCVADADWLERLADTLCAEPEAAGVGGPIANAPTSGGVARFLASTDFYRHRVRQGEVDYLLTANVAFRRSALIDVAGFSERDGAWGEDADLSFRLRQRGYRLLVCAAGGITHYGSPPSVRAFARELYRYGYGNSVLSRNWTNGRTPAVELARHAGAVILAPALALRYASRVGLRQAISFCPLLALEHAAFVVGLLHAELRGAAQRLASWHGEHTALVASVAPGDVGAASIGSGWDLKGDPGGTATDAAPLVSVLMPVYNEAAWIARSLRAVLAQEYPAERLEILVIDGASDDETLRVVESLPQARRVRVLHNPARLQASGLNIGLRAARGEIVVRVDAHTVIAPDYMRACVAALAATGAANVGGRMEPVGITATGKAIALATTSRFGVPTAFHTSSAAQETDTVYLGAWPRVVLERAGGFDEALPINEDYELNYRIRQAGGRIYLTPTIRSLYFGRQSWRAVARQYFNYGHGKARMLKKRPASLRPRQLVAPTFVAALALGPLVSWLPLRPQRARQWARRLGPIWSIMFAIYVALNLVAALRAIRRAPERVPWSVRWRVPLAFLAVHLSWGVGFWAGVFAQHSRPARPSPHVSWQARERAQCTGGPNDMINCGGSAADGRRRRL